MSDESHFGLPIEACIEKIVGTVPVLPDKNYELCDTHLEAIANECRQELLERNGLTEDALETEMAKKVNVSPKTMAPFINNHFNRILRGFDLRHELVEGFRKYILSRNESNTHDLEFSRVMHSLLKSFCSGLEMPNHALRPIALENAGSWTFRDIPVDEVLDESSNTWTVRTIRVDEVTNEEASNRMFLPKVHEIFADDDISDLLGGLLENGNPETIAFNLGVGIGDDGDVKFTIHRAADNVLPHFVHDGQAIDAQLMHRDDGLDLARNIDKILGCCDHHGFIIDDGNGGEIELTISTGENFHDFTSDDSIFSKLLRKVLTMANVSVVKLATTASHQQATFFNVNNELLREVIQSGKKMVFENVHFFEPTIWRTTGQALGEIEFKCCNFAEGAFYNRENAANGSQPLKLAWTELNDSMMAIPVAEFLGSLISGVQDGRIIEVKFSSWEFKETSSEEAIAKFAELKSVLADGLVLDRIRFFEGTDDERTEVDLEQILNRIEELNLGHQNE